MSRLEEIKQTVKMIDLAYEIDCVMTTEDSDKMKVIKRDDVKWLISRVEELEEELNTSIERGMRTAYQNVRYKQALEEIRNIIDVTPYREYSTNKIRHRLFDIANEALKGDNP